MISRRVALSTAAAATTGLVAPFVVTRQRATALAAAEGIAAERRLLESGKKRVSHLIAEGATEWQADLIVVGTHGRHGFDRMVVGSVAEKLVRIAETSVLLVKADRPI